MRNPWVIICAILEDGARAIMIWIGITIAMLIVAIAVGFFMISKYGVLVGVFSSFFVFVLGKVIALSIFETIILEADPVESSESLPSHKEEIDDLRKELE